MKKRQSENSKHQQYPDPSDQEDIKELVTKHFQLEQNEKVLFISNC
jgi:hypothetical protein